MVSRSGFASGRDERRGTDDHAAVRAVDGDLLALADDDAADRADARGLVDPQRVAAGDAGLAHAARDDRRVRGHAAVRGENALRRGEPVDVVGRRVEANEDQRLVLAALGRDVGVEDDGSDRGAG